MSNGNTHQLTFVASGHLNMAISTPYNAFGMHPPKKNTNDYKNAPAVMVLHHSNVGGSRESHYSLTYCTFYAFALSYEAVFNSLMSFQPYMYRKVC